MNAAIYMRTSTLEQHPENQLTACRAFATSRGYNVQYELVEQVSAYKDVERPKYEEVKQLAHEGKIKVVIVWALDRWSRKLETTLKDVGYFRDRGVLFHSVREPFLEAVNIEGPMGSTIRDFLYGLIGSMAEMESQIKSERVKEGLERTRRQGTVLGAPKAKFNKFRAAQLLREGRSLREVAQEVGVSPPTIMRYRNELEKISEDYLNE